MFASTGQNGLVNKTVLFFFLSKLQCFCRVKKFDGIILVMNGLGAEDLLYNQICGLQLFVIIAESVTQSEGV